MMKPTDTPLGGLTRLAQWGFAAVFCLFLFGTWMDRMREQNDWTLIWSVIGLWVAFFVLVLTIEFAVLRIVAAIEHGVVPRTPPGKSTGVAQIESQVTGQTETPKRIAKAKEA